MTEINTVREAAISPQIVHVSVTSVIDGTFS